MEEIKKFYSTIGGRIADARQSIGLSQEKAAKVIGVTRVTWNHIEKGNQKLSVDRLLEIADLLKISPSKLVPGLDAKEHTDVATEIKFSSEEQSIVLKKLAKYK